MTQRRDVEQTAIVRRMKKNVTRQQKNVTRLA
jgi:hypothetical protein